MKYEKGINILEKHNKKKGVLCPVVDEKKCTTMIDGTIILRDAQGIFLGATYKNELLCG